MSETHNLDNEKNGAGGGRLKPFVMWLKHLFKHDWLYDSPGPRNGQWHRECQYCGKRQHATYDMMYGSTDWHDGW